MTHSSMRVLAGAAVAVVFAVAVALPAHAADVDKIAESCAGCHGKDGVSTESDVPTIAGVSAPYLNDSMTSYKDKQRPCPETKYRSGPKKGQKTDMCKTAKELSAADIKAVADYFAGKKFVPADQPFDAALAKKGKELHELHCEKCHSEGGSSPDDDAGILAGQHKGYLMDTFAQYKAGKRPMDKKMKPKIDKLNKSDIEALINYYESFR